MRARLILIALLVLPALTACGNDDSGDDTSSTKAEGCEYVKDAQSASEPADLPPSEPVSASTMVVETNRGTMTFALKPDQAPCTVNSFVSLAKQGYFEGTKCHRLVPQFVLQCGDPTATGTGGPGYSFKDELSGSETYPAGTLAMANAGPDTNGSQFFVVLADTQLDPNYTVFGTVDAEGLKVAQDIEKAGNGPDGVAPAQDVILEKVTLS